MDKATIIDQIGNYLGAASAVECSLVLTFLQHMIPAGGQEPGHGFVLSNPTAAEIVYIINRNADNERFLRKLLTQAVVYERLLHKEGDSSKPSGKVFTFTQPDAIEIAHIMSRCQNSPVFLHELLVHAINVEDLYITHPRGQQPASK